MHVTNDATKYISDAFLHEGIVAKQEDIARVFLYEEKWWDVQTDDNHIEVTMVARDAVVEYIMRRQPGMSRKAIEDILKLQDDAFNALR